jgi:transposase-like protein
MAITNDILDELIGNAKSQDDLFGKDGVIKDLSKQLMERMLQGEMAHHLGHDKHAVEGHHTGNSRNGKGKKTVKTGNGKIEIEVPRDRNSEFQPILIEKRQGRLKE